MLSVSRVVLVFLLFVSSYGTVAQPLPQVEREFRAALGEFPTGVVVVSATAPAGDWLGMTVSSFNSVSLDPPLVMFSIARRALSFAAWHEVDRFAVNGTLP